MRSFDYAPLWRRFAQDFGSGLPLRIATLLSLTPAKRLNFIGDALRDYLDPRSRIEAGL